MEKQTTEEFTAGYADGKFNGWFEASEVQGKPSEEERLEFTEVAKAGGGEYNLGYAQGYMFGFNDACRFLADERTA